MPRHTHGPGVRATFETEWLELPDNNLTRATYVLAPTFFFGDGFHVEAVEDAPQPSAEFPHRSTVMATLSRKLFKVMIRYQAGSEARGDDPPDWAYVEDSAVDAETGAPLDQANF